MLRKNKFLLEACRKRKNTSSPVPDELFKGLSRIMQKEIELTKEQLALINNLRPECFDSMQDLQNFLKLKIKREKKGIIMIPIRIIRNYDC